MKFGHLPGGYHVDQGLGTLNTCERLEDLSDSSLLVLMVRSKLGRLGLRVCAPLWAQRIDSGCELWSRIHRRSRNLDDGHRAYNALVREIDKFTRIFGQLKKGEKS